MAKRSGASRRKKAKERAAAAAARAVAYPSWVLFERYCVQEVEDSSSVADLNTLAACRTSAGSPIAVALSVARPPEASRVCVQLPGDDTVANNSVVVASHGDSILIRVSLKEDSVVDHYVYNAGDTSTDPPRPPSLLLLPPFYPPEEEEQNKWLQSLGRRPQPRPLHTDSTGILRRGNDEILVAELEIDIVEGSYCRPHIPQSAPELVMLRSGQWSVTRPAFSNSTTTADGNKLKEMLSMWLTNTVVPIGDRMLCWSDRRNSVFLSDMFDESPTLRYVPFPVESCCGFAVCATAGGDSVNVVSIFPDCQCNDEDGWSSDEGYNKCWCSIDTYTVRTWMLRMDDMTWVMDGTVHATELWALDAYQNLPRDNLSYPVVSLDDPNTITFELCEVNNGGDETMRLVMVDLRKKLIPAVFCYPPERKCIYFEYLIPSRVSVYLNSSPSQCNGGGTVSVSEIHETAAAAPVVS